MNGKDIFLGLNYIDRKFVEEAQTADLGRTSGIRTLRRPLALAALIALMLMLVGCAAAVLYMDTYGRGIHMELSDGMTNATYRFQLHFGEGYTIYFPQDGGTLEQTSNPKGTPVFLDSWKSSTVDHAELTVACFSGKTTEEVRTLLTDQEADYNLTLDRNGVLTGKNGDGTVDINIYLYEGDGCMYAVTSRYPSASASTLGKVLCFLAKGFMTGPE